MSTSQPDAKFAQSQVGISFRSSLKKAKSKKEEQQEDVLQKLGFGICAYRNLLWYLWIMFLIGSCLNIPSIFLYRKGTAFQSGAVISKEQFSLGNFGYSSV